MEVRTIVKNNISKLFLSVIILFGLAACSGEPEEVENNEQQNQTKTEVTNDQDSEKDVTELLSEVQNNSPTEDRIQALEEIAMHYYWYGGDLEVAEEEVFKGITLHGDYDAVEESFKQATTLDPFNLDLKYSLASAQILQKKIPEALKTYEELLNFDEDHFEAQLMYTVYSKVDGNEDDFQSGLEKLKKIDNDLAETYQEKINFIEEIKTVELNTDVPDDLSEEDHAFVTLGYALSEEGEMEETLIERLKVVKEAAEKYPESKIIVTGGVPKQGNTEAELMYDWLVENGIEKERIFKEDMATDTVENALFSMEIAKNENVKDITVISSATHMRRALAVFTEVSHMMAKKGDDQTDRDISNIVYMDFESDEEFENVQKDEDLVIYRDFMRATGIWQFPGLQR